MVERQRNSAHKITPAAMAPADNLDTSFLYLRADQLEGEESLIAAELLKQHEVFLAAVNQLQAIIETAMSRTLTLRLHGSRLLRYVEHRVASPKKFHLFKTLTLQRLIIEAAGQPSPTPSNIEYYIDLLEQARDHGLLASDMPVPRVPPGQRPALTSVRQP